jgi:archaellum component FlaC
MAVRLAVVSLLGILAMPQSAASVAREGSGETAPKTELVQAEQQLREIQQSLVEKGGQLGLLKQRLQTTKDPAVREELRKEIESLETNIESLQSSFEEIALGGADQSVFQEQKTDEFDWREEVLQIFRPLLEELKELTEKPRAIEKLRSQHALLQRQEVAAAQALTHLTKLQAMDLGEPAETRIAGIEKEWRKRLDDIREQNDIVRFQLEKLLGENQSIIERTGDAVGKFARGRGLTLFLGIVVFLGVFLTMHVLQRFYRLWIERRGDTPGTATKLTLFLFRVLAVVLAALGALLVFYIASDLVLLGLSFILLVALGLGFRTYLPRFFAETQLVLNIGSVREGERLVYQGIPWQVSSLNVFSLLHNPELENGTLRLSLREIRKLVSRPCLKAEPWFPTRPGDCVLLADGTFGAVERQTPEIVQLRVVGSSTWFGTADFLAAKPRNLSREGFRVVVTFGIDYRHQAISTTEVPDALQDGVKQALRESPLSDHIQKVSVEFDQAGLDSLDYAIIVTFGGGAAPHYLATRRLIQRACVEVCSKREWNIPFRQLTVHQPDGENP